MGQYFAPVNTDKQEFVCPWCIDGIAKLYEWATSPGGSLLTLLLRKSTESGGGDIPRDTYEHDRNAIVGRWAGDRVILVGDYDESNLWQELYEGDNYRNISHDVVLAWNGFMPLDRQLNYEHCSDCCTKQHQPKAALIVA